MRQTYYVIEESRCAGCGACERVCPHGAVTAAGARGPFAIDQARCRHCGMCFRACPAKAVARPYDLYQLSEGLKPRP
ncbi:MAG: 4Fe-4S dicluster domain-containing protein [Adlercreutzia sp.]|nr:4Fe-4S dicluster domain-containing protein [Adlercreutzia sp.]